MSHEKALVQIQESRNKEEWQYKAAESSKSPRSWSRVKDTRTTKWLMVSRADQIKIIVNEKTKNDSTERTIKIQDLKFVRFGTGSARLQPDFAS